MTSSYACAWHGYHRDSGQVFLVPAWFKFSYGYQIVGAGNKEKKGMLKMRNVKLRSRAGILQKAFARFAANSICLVAAWLRWSVLTKEGVQDDLSVGLIAR